MIEFKSSPASVPFVSLRFKSSPTHDVMVSEQHLGADGKRAAPGLARARPGAAAR
jgi:hypothetical protein